jgi:hypothetical protein
MATLPAYDPRLDPEALLSQTEAAALLGCTRRKLEKDRKAGVGAKYIRTSQNRVRYRRRDLLAYISELEAGTMAITEELRAIDRTPKWKRG